MKFLLRINEWRVAIDLEYTILWLLEEHSKYLLKCFCEALALGKETIYQDCMEPLCLSMDSLLSLRSCVRYQLKKIELINVSSVKRIRIIFSSTVKIQGSFAISYSLALGFVMDITLKSLTCLFEMTSHLFGQGTHGVWRTLYLF